MWIKSHHVWAKEMTQQIKHLPGKPENMKIVSYKARYTWKSTFNLSLGRLKQRFLVQAGYTKKQIWKPALMVKWRTIYEDT